MTRRTARLRLTVLYGGLFLVSGVALLAATYLLFERATAVSKPRLPKIPHAPAIQPLSEPQLPAALSGLYRAQQQLTQAQHRLSLLPLGTTRGQLPVTLQLRQDEHELTRDQRRLSTAIAQLSKAVHQVARSGSAQAAQRASDSHQLLVDSSIALAVLAALAVLSGWIVAGRMLEPIRTITRTARRISSSSLHERLALEGPEDELKELGDTLDDLFARLEAAFDAQRRFVAHASHELRTPITRERALVQVALADPATPSVWRSTAEELLASNRAQETLIDALLTLASSERGLDRRERVDLSVVAGTILHDRRESDRLGLEVDASLEAAPVDGDPGLLESLVANLVDNALRHNVDGGCVRVSTGSDDGNAVLTVSNTGPVVEFGEVDRLFQPFQRLDPRRRPLPTGSRPRPLDRLCRRRRPPCDGRRPAPARRRSFRRRHVPASRVPRRPIDTTAYVCLRSLACDSA